MESRFKAPLMQGLPKHSARRSLLAQTTMRGWLRRSHRSRGVTRVDTWGVSKGVIRGVTCTSLMESVICRAGSTSSSYSTCKSARRGGEFRASSGEFRASSGEFRASSGEFRKSTAPRPNPRTVPRGERGPPGEA
eukprot:3048292-Pyramimonas_sp.AAC.1